VNLNPRCIGCGIAVIHVNETMCAPCLTALESLHVPYFPNAETKMEVASAPRLPATRLVAVA